LNPEVEFCAGDYVPEDMAKPDGQIFSDSCTGDSGGPLLCTDGDVQAFYGIVSKTALRNRNLFFSKHIYTYLHI